MEVGETNRGPGHGRQRELGARAVAVVMPRRGLTRAGAPATTVPALHDHPDPLRIAQHPDVGERVAVDHEQVGDRPGA